MRVELGLLAGFRQQGLRGLVDRVGATAGKILNLELEAQHKSVRHAEQLWTYLVDDVGGAHPRAAFIPWLQDRKQRRRVRLVGESQEVEACNGDDVLDTRRGEQLFAHLPGHLVRSLERGAVG